jgi:hypothetical protein
MGIAAAVGKIRLAKKGRTKLSSKSRSIASRRESISPKGDGRRTGMDISHLLVGCPTGALVSPVERSGVGPRHRWILEP